MAAAQEGRKYILRTDLMFERCTPLNALRPSYISDPRYVRAEELYEASIKAQQAGDPGRSTLLYLEAMEIQAGLPSSLSDRPLVLGSAWQRLPLQILNQLLSCLPLEALLQLSEASITWSQVAAPPGSQLLHFQHSA